MKPSQIASALNVAITAHLPVMIWGPAGVGKSEVAHQVADRRKVELRDVRLANLDPTDIKGFPVPDAKKGVMTWLPADFMPRTGKGILFFDELNLADKMTQASCYQLMLTREVGNYKLPPGWDIIAAGNTEKDRANVTRMAGPLANRMVHLTFEPDLPEWAAYAQSIGVAAELVAFVRFKKDLLHSFDANSKEPAFPSPRSWVHLDRLLKESAKQQAAPDVVDGLIDGTVGSGAGIELRAFFDHIKDLPTPEEVEADPSGAPMPSKISARHAISLRLASAATPANLPKFLKYMSRMQSQEMEVLFVRDAGNTNPAIRTTQTYRDWTVANCDVVL